jgi:hypothetical protein
VSPVFNVVLDFFLTSAERIRREVESSKVKKSRCFMNSPPDSDTVRGRRSSGPRLNEVTSWQIAFSVTLVAFVAVLIALIVELTLPMATSNVAGPPSQIDQTFVGQTARPPSQIDQTFVGQTARSRTASQTQTFNGPIGQLRPPMDNFPRLLHLMYIPYDFKTQTFKFDASDEFDHTYAEDWREKLADTRWQVRLWTWTELCNVAPKPLLHYVLSRCTRPMQLIDFFRIWLLWKLGGVNLQYGSELEQLEHCVPQHSSMRLFTEFTCTQRRALSIASPRYQSVWTRRVCIALFGCYPNSPLLFEFLVRSLVNLSTFRVECDNDVLQCGGPVLFTEVVWTTLHTDFEVLSGEERRCKFQSIGSWRAKECPYSLTPPKTPAPLSFAQACELLRCI